MSRSIFGTRVHQFLGALTAGSRRKERRPELRRSPQLESLEGRALMATINASATISSVADGPNFNYTLTLNNSSTSNSGIGTFWYSWVPGEDFMASSPISVAPPAGWTDNITNEGPADGFAIQFLANSSAAAVQPGSSLTFSFVSTDSPASVNGNSVDYPGMPVDTATVYPGAPFSDAGHEFVVTPVSAPAPTPTPTSPPLVTVTNVQIVENRKNQVTEVIVDYSGAVNASEADNVATYRLATAGKKGSFTAKNAMVIKLKSAKYNGTTDAVTLTPKKAFSLMKTVQLEVKGESLADSAGSLLDGANDGQAGSNYVTILRPIVLAPPVPTPVPKPTPAPVRTPVPVPVPVPMPTPMPTPTPMPPPPVSAPPGY
jgi:hypothetical protein